MLSPDQAINQLKVHYKIGRDTDLEKRLRLCPGQCYAWRKRDRVPLRLMEELEKIKENPLRRGRLSEGEKYELLELFERYSQLPGRRRSIIRKKLSQLISGETIR